VGGRAGGPRRGGHPAVGGRGAAARAGPPALTRHPLGRADIRQLRETGQAGRNTWSATREGCSERSPTTRSAECGGGPEVVGTSGATHDAAARRVRVVATAFDSYPPG